MIAIQPAWKVSIRISFCHGLFAFGYMHTSACVEGAYILACILSWRSCQKQRGRLARLGLQNIQLR